MKASSILLLVPALVAVGWLAWGGLSEEDSRLLEEDGEEAAVDPGGASRSGRTDRPGGAARPAVRVEAERGPEPAVGVIVPGAEPPLREPPEGGLGALVRVRSEPGEEVTGKMLLAAVSRLYLVRTLRAGDVAALEALAVELEFPEARVPVAEIVEFWRSHGFEVNEIGGVLEVHPHGGEERR